MANLKKINLGGTSYDIVDNGGRLLIGTPTNLKTNVKTDLVVAINEVFDAVGTGGANAVVTVEKSTDGLAYTLKQGGKEVATINIPKDMVVNGGSYADGNLTLNIANGEPVVIPVRDLIDLYTGGSNSEIAVNVDSSNVITATLADKGITTSKIADKAVTRTKLGSDVLEVFDQLTEASATAETNAKTYAKNYADGLAGNYATKAQGAKADSAYQKPTTGIPAIDFTTEVKQLLTKADTAYQKPSTGITKGDLASGVQASLDKADESLKTIEIDAECQDYLHASTSNRSTELLLDVASVATATKSGEGLADAYEVKSLMSATHEELQENIDAVSTNLNNLAKGLDANFTEVENAYNNLGKRIATATKETFVYDAETETLTITSSAV